MVSVRTTKLTDLCIRAHVVSTVKTAELLSRGSVGEQGRDRKQASKPVARATRGLYGAVAVLGAWLSVGASAYAGTVISGCSSSATSSLVSFLESAADFAIAIGAAGALLMLAVGALAIILGGTTERVSWGMNIIKHAVIGLGLLALGLFIRFIIIDVIVGATGTKGPSATTQACLKKGTI